MPFEVFKDRGGRFTQPRITIGKSGIISINEKCYTRYFAGKKKAILYFNDETKEIGVEPTNSEEDYAYPIRRAKKSKTYYVSAVSFLNRYEIKPDKKTVYNVHWDEKHNFLIALKAEQLQKKEDRKQQSESLFKQD